MVEYTTLPSLISLVNLVEYTDSQVLIYVNGGIHNSQDLIYVNGQEYDRIPKSNW